MTGKFTLYEPLVWQTHTNRVFLSSGFDCPVGCVYCYIYNDGYALGPPRPSRLTGDEVKRRLVSDSRFKAGKNGTIVSIGCVSEPFHPVLEEKTLEYMESLSDLGNPIQFAAKFPVSDWGIRRIAKIDAPVYPMISISTLKNYRALEPAAPPPLARLAGIRKLANAGLHTTLLFKPVMPGVNENEQDQVIRAALDYGAKSLVAGIMYINNYLAKKLEESGFDTKSLQTRGTDPVQPIWVENEISPVKSHDLLDSIIQKARLAGLKAFKDTVCVISEDLRIACPVRGAYPQFCSGHTPIG